MAVCNLLVSPFLMLFLLIYFFMRNAEKFYHHPSSIGARRWSGLAYWRMREFNELPHYIQHRSAATHLLLPWLLAVLSYWQPWLIVLACMHKEIYSIQAQ